MNAYLFSAGATFCKETKAIGSDAPSGRIGIVNEVVHWDSCSDMIVGAATPDEAQQRFQDWMLRDQEGLSVEIKKVVAGQFFGRLLTESGNDLLDWNLIATQAQAQVEATAADDFEQGYWVDVNEALAITRSASSLDALQGSLGNDMREGLNWAPDKTFFFIVNVLRTGGAAAVERENGLSIYDDAEAEKDTGMAAGGSEIDLPELKERDAAALVVARNSVVAIWLWRQFAATTPLADHPIQLIPWCGAIGFDLPG